jgi:hypothetical protein
VTGLYVQVAGAVWPLLPFLQGRAVALTVPSTRGRALDELLAVVAVLEQVDAAPGRAA